MAKRGRKNIDTHTKVEIILHAEVYGDEAAIKRFSISARMLRNYRALVREEGSEIAGIFRLYREKLAPPEAKAEAHAAWLQQQIAKANKTFHKHLKTLQFTGPESLRAITEHMGRLLDRQELGAYLDTLYGSNGNGTHED